jgi:Zn-dependent membrane protease YugP
MDLVLILIIIVIPLLAQLSININYNTYKGINNNNKMTGYDIARKILDANGLTEVKVKKVSGNLSDHYDPSLKVVSLSDSIYDGTSVASTSVAAHECGHAIQDKDNYSFMQIRSAIFPIVNIATSLSYWIILFGFIFEIVGLVYIGIIFTCIGLLFQIITLPVEFNASSRAKQQLIQYNLITSEEEQGVKKVLGAAAMTYVAGVIASSVQILRLLLIAQDRR